MISCLNPEGLDLKGPTVYEAVEQGLPVLVFRNDGFLGWVLQPVKNTKTLEWDAPAEWHLDNPLNTFIDYANYCSKAKLLTITRIEENKDGRDPFNRIGCFKIDYNCDGSSPHVLTGWMEDLDGVTQAIKAGSLDFIYAEATKNTAWTETARRVIVFTFIFADMETRNSCLPR